MKRLTIIFLSILLLAARPAASDVLVVPIRKVIDGGLAEFVRRIVAEAETDRAEAIVFRIDTPGGRVDSAVDIKDTILATEIKTVAFIDKNAISAGSLISLACDSIYMSTGASIGAATAVDLQGKKASEKVISYFRAQMRATAEANGRRADIAEAMVDDELIIEDVVEEGKLLTLTYTEALELGISDGTVDTVGGVLNAIGLEGSVVTEVKPNWAENLVRLFTHPMVSSLLMSIGFLGLLIEIRTPGWGVAGTAGLVALMLFFGSHYIVRLAGAGEMIMFAAGVVLLTLEVLVIPGFGIAGVSGIGLIVASLYLSMVGRMPYHGDYTVAAASLLGAFVLIIIGGYMAMKLLPRTEMFQRLVLNTEMASAQGYASAETDAALIGRQGVALSDLRPAGKAEVDGRRIDVVTEGEFVAKGSMVTVMDVRGSRVVVR